MRLIGIFLWSVGAAIVAYAMLVFDTSVGFGGSRVVNLGLQQQQTMIALCGGILFLAGVVLHGLSFLRPAASKLEDADESDSASVVLQRFGRLPLPQADISDSEIARQEADSRAFMANNQ